MAEVEWLDRHVVKINGWSFDFRDMIARRNNWAVGPYRAEVRLIYLDSKACVTSDAKALSEIVQPPTTSNHGTWDYAKWFSFFTPPEDHYNKMIDDAYTLYLFEQALISERKQT